MMWNTHLITLIISVEQHTLKYFYIDQVFTKALKEYADLKKSKGKSFYRIVQLFIT